MGRETSAALKELFERAQTWPDEMQAEAVRLLRALDGPAHQQRAGVPHFAEQSGEMPQRLEALTFFEWQGLGETAGAHETHLRQKRPGETPGRFKSRCACCEFTGSG